MDTGELLDHLKIAALNAGEYDEVILHRSLIDAAIETINRLSALREEARSMKLTDTESAIWQMLTDVPGKMISPKVIAERVSCSVESVWAHKCRLLGKVRDYQKGRIITVRGEGYMYVAN